MNRDKSSFLGNLFQCLFYGHFALIAILLGFLTIRGTLSDDHEYHFLTKIWYPIALSSSLCTSIVAFLSHLFTSLCPLTAFRVSFWLSPLLTCALGILLVSLETLGTLAASIVFMISAILLSLYACWASPRFEHSSKILAVSIAHCPPKVKIVVFLSLIVGTLYSFFLMCGIGGAITTRTSLDIVFVVLILASLAWTMQIIKNAMQVTVSHVKYMKFMCGVEVDYKTAVTNAVKHSMGTICIGSILVPLFTVVRGLARAVCSISGDVDEFMFSCADCCAGLATGIVVYANRWGFVHVGVYNKGIMQASRVTWETFRGVGMEELINSDLTSSFCFFSGMAAGSISGLLSGILAIFLHKSYTAEVALYTFLAGYLVNRVAMAWIQSSVSGYYVAYADNPQSQQFDSTIPNYVIYLQRSAV